MLSSADVTGLCVILGFPFRLRDLGDRLMTAFSLTAFRLRNVTAPLVSGVHHGTDTHEEPSFAGEGILLRKRYAGELIFESLLFAPNLHVVKLDRVMRSTSTRC